ncbi:hypothetical protein FGG08_001221 [Glutinoglossum americanum]|uniref:Uncharacterized protein n=1 Tax=Glutinoglossum americanum TaxID=1670608 RepID=A0A9P8IE07_9PEZI|nr:hypothetical protein FGG08_001221 [Glutinoglossum americanum]
MCNKIMDEQVGELAKEGMSKILQLEDAILNHKAYRAIFQEGMKYISDLMEGKWNEFLPGNVQANETTPEDIQLAVIEMAKGVINKGYRTEEEIHKDKAQVYNIIRSHFARGYVRGQESVTTGAKVLNMDPWFLHGIEIAGQNADPGMPPFFTRDSGARGHWSEVSLGRLRPWGDKGNYKPAEPDAFGYYPDDPVYLALAAIEMQRNGIREEDYTIRHYPLAKNIRLPFLGWSPISPETYQTWSAKTLFQDTAGNRRLMYERKDLDISRLRELIALKERWAEQDLQYLRRYRRYVVCDPESRGKEYIDGGDISYLPAQRSPTVERVKTVVMEPMSGVIGTATVGGESEGGSADERDLRKEPSCELESGSQLHTASFLASLLPEANRPKRMLTPPIPPRSPAQQLTTNNPTAGVTNSDNINSPIVTQIDEFISELVAPPPVKIKPNQMKHSISAPHLHLSKSYGGSRSKCRGYRVSAIPRPLSAARKGTEKPLPLLPEQLAHSVGLPSHFGDGGEEAADGEPYQDPELLPNISPPARALSPLSTIRGSPYILRNSQPQRRSSPESVQAYARAVEDLHGLCRLNRYYSNSSVNSHKSKEDGGDDSGEGNSSGTTRMLTTKTVRGRLVRVSPGGGVAGARSEITHDGEASVYSADVGGKGEEESAVAGCFGGGRGGKDIVVERTEPQKRWGTLRRGGSQPWGKARKDIANGIKHYFGKGK